MRSSWSSDLLVSVDRHARQPLRAQLEHQFRDAIRTGKLQPGERVPSSRELAAALGLSRGLIQECYAQLQAEGYLTSWPGSATRVRIRNRYPSAALTSSTSSASKPRSFRRLRASLTASR